MYNLTVTYPSNAPGHADLTAHLYDLPLESVAQVVENMTVECDAETVADSLMNAFDELNVIEMTFAFEGRTFKVVKA